MRITLGTRPAQARFPEILHFRILDSTNEELRRRIVQGTSRDGLVVIADQQTSGRGRRGRTWASPEGNLHLSLVRRMDEPHHLTTAMTLVAGQALAEALETVTGERPGLKWPNDLLLAGRKVAGILVEGHDGWQIIGVGVNLGIRTEELPPELHGTATTLRDHFGSAPDPMDLAARFLEIFTDLEADFLNRRGLDLKAWNRYFVDRDQPIRTLGQDPIDGVVLDVTPLGVLRIRDNAGRVHEIRSGEVIRR